MAVHYEWDVEEWEGEDIVDHNQNASLKDFGAAPPLVDGQRFRLVLVRNLNDKHDSLLEREWAYAFLQNGKWSLPVDFKDADDRTGERVPKRFHEELARSGW